MTVNERLWLAGLMDDFDAAVAARDRLRVTAILQEVYLDEKTVEAILNREMRDS